MPAPATSEPGAPIAMPRGLAGPVMLLLIVSALVLTSVSLLIVRNQDDRKAELADQSARAALMSHRRELAWSAHALTLELRSLSADAGNAEALQAPTTIIKLREQFPESIEFFILDGNRQVTQSSLPDGTRWREMESALNGHGPLKRLFEASLQAGSGGPVRTTGLFKAGGMIYAAAIASLLDPEGATDDIANWPAFVMVASRFDSHFLEWFGKTFSLRGLHTGSNFQAESQANLALLSSDGRTLGVLAWESEASGLQQLREFVAPVAGAWAVMIGLAWVFVQRSLQIATSLERGRAAERERLILKENAHSLQTSRERYRTLFDEVPIAIQEEDWSRIRSEIMHRMSASGGRLREAVHQTLSEGRESLPAIEIVDVNKATLRIYSATDKAPCMAALEARRCEFSDSDFEQTLLLLADGFPVTSEQQDTTLSGQEIYVCKHIFIPDAYQHDWSRVLVTVEDITERKWAQERIENLAHYDQITNLPNRLLFHERLDWQMAQASRNDESFALLSLDLDDFKSINDGLGDAAGNQLLREVGDRLKQLVRASDAVGRDVSEPISRLGGDEFSLILGSVKNSRGVATVAERIVESFSKPFTVDGNPVHTGTSIGIAFYPDDGDVADKLIRSANLALYRSKAHKVKKYHFYVQKMDEETSRRKGLERDLRQALDRDELWLAYQPLVDAQSGEIIAAEALARWTHAEHGLIAPDEFVPIAEQTNLIIPIGEWVMSEACKRAQLWRTSGHPPIAVSVNISGIQIQFHDVLSMTRSALDAAALEPSGLHVEITENVMMNHLDTAIATMTDLRELGVEIHLDDFGTGYSSLSYLKRFPLDTLKIDRSFVRDLMINPDDLAILQAIVRVAHAFDLKVVAEGVETVEQLDVLRREGVNLLQGHYFGVASPAEEFEALLNGKLVTTNAGKCRLIEAAACPS